MDQQQITEALERTVAAGIRRTRSGARQPVSMIDRLMSAVPDDADVVAVKKTGPPTELALRLDNAQQRLKLRPSPSN